jgi:hypothetical protein
MTALSDVAGAAFVGAGVGACALPASNSPADASTASAVSQIRPRRIVVSCRPRAFRALGRIIDRSTQAVNVQNQRVWYSPEISLPV